MKISQSSRRRARASGLALSAVVLAASCGSSNDTANDETATDEPQETATETSSAESSEVSDDETNSTDGGASGATCDEIAASFQTAGSANDDLPVPEVAATCDGDTVTVTSNQIPDFPYIETSPGAPQEYDLEFSIPATPVVADAPAEVPALGPLGVAVNGVPIYGQAEGTGGDVLSLGSGFTECGGHNGPTGYHFHTFDVTGSDTCMFSEEEAQAGPILFGYAFDGYPIYGAIFQYSSSYELTDESLFATDTWSAHTYVEGSGDLDECNGRTDENGNYAYYATETFPYTVGCFRGEVDPAVSEGPGGPPGGGGDGDDGGRPPRDDG